MVEHWNMNRRLIALLVVALALTAFVGAPARAADTGTTSATLTIGGGGLNVSVPTGTVNLGTVTPGTLAATGQLGNVTVADTRGALDAIWTASVTSTEFALTSATVASERIAKSAIRYSSGAGTPATTLTVGAFVPSVLASLETTATAGTWAGVGSNSVTWNPTITFTLLNSQVAGTYSGTITHSVT